MTFSEHLIETVFRPRLKAHRALVVYDPNSRYKEICERLEGENCKVIFAEQRPISARTDAMSRWIEMGSDTTFQSQLLIHTTDKAPTDNDDRQQDPFASYASIGASFPSRASDEYKQLCYRFLKDRTTEIDQLFAGNSEPEFDVIDNLAGGTNSHPRLQKLFGTADASRIFPDFLVPAKILEDQLESDSDWVTEFSQLAQRTLGFNFDPRATKPKTIREKLWQYLLFSEFAHDLPCELPSSLSDIPRASNPQLGFAIDLCAQLRKHADTKESYREVALSIEEKLDLAKESEGIKSLGDLDTFSFEEKTFLARAVVAVRTEDLDTASSILEKHKNGIWAEEGERKLLWRIVELGLNVLEGIKRSIEQLKVLGHSGSELCALYDSDLVKVDRYYRELEEAAAQTLDGYEEIQDVITTVRKAYRNHFNQLQNRFLATVEREGWPLNGMPSNASTFDELVAPELRAGKRVVYFMIDALRLDLSQVIESDTKTHKVVRKPTCAQLPCVTRFGMASLLPDTDTKLRFEKTGREFNPVYDGKEIGKRKERIGIIESLFNDRVVTMRLSDFIEKTKTKKAKENFTKETSNSDLLVLTSTELDDLGEGSSTSQLQLIPSVVQELQRAIKLCSEFNYDKAVIATDHGFIWVEDQDAGSVCEKPPGNGWQLAKRRCLIGSGDEAPGTIRFSTKELSIPTNEPSFVVPRALATFSKGTGYFHEGLSLQESLVSRIVVEFVNKQSASRIEANPEIELSRKKKTVASRIVSINISWPGAADMFSEGTEFKVVGIQKKKEIAQPVSGEAVNSTSGLVKMSQGESIKISLRLNQDAEEGPFIVKALNPQTEKTLDSLELSFQPTVF